MLAAVLAVLLLGTTSVASACDLCCGMRAMHGTRCHATVATAAAMGDCGMAAMRQTAPLHATCSRAECAAPVQAAVVREERSAASVLSDVELPMRAIPWPERVVATGDAGVARPPTPVPPQLQTTLRL